MFRILFLGTGSSRPNPERGHPAILVQHETATFMLDCGEGAALHLAQAVERDLVPRSVLEDPLHMLLTHGHLDHFLGVAGCLILLSSETRRPPRDVDVHGSFLTIERVRRLVMMYSLDQEDSIEEGVRYSIVTPGVFWENEELVIEAYATNHRPALGASCLGFALQEKGGGAKLVYTGDTGFSEAVVDAAKDATCLITEASTSAEETEKAKRVGHQTALQAATVAQRANVRHLLLTHIGERFRGREAELLEEAATVFPDTRVVNDFDRFTLDAEGLSWKR